MLSSILSEAGSPSGAGKQKSYSEYYSSVCEDHRKKMREESVCSNSSIAGVRKSRPKKGCA